MTTPETSHQGLNLRILDLSRVLAGPLCTMTLGDLGAHVIKVERPGTGDETRGWGPPVDSRGESAYFLAINRNKRSLAADLGAPADRDLVAQLAADADVVVENFRPGVLRKHGLSIDQLLQRNPRLICCTISGFGEDSTRAGYDLVVQAESGWMSITGEPDGNPMKVGVALADVIAGKDAAIAILAAVAERELAGAAGLGVERRRLHVSLMASATASLINVAQNALVSGRDARRWGNQHPNLVPYQLFHATDRPLVIGVGSDAQWKACANALDLPELAGDPALETNAGRLAGRDRIVRAMYRRLAERTAQEWITRLDEARVPCGLVRTVLEALEGAGGSPLTGMPPAATGKVRLPPPRLDEHGAEIRRLGWHAFGGD